MDREILSKRPVKFLTLLLTAMLIASASAAVYYSLSMTSTVDVYGANVYFVEGVDNGTAGVNISPDGMVAQMATLRAYPNVTTTYDDPIKVANNGTTAYSIRLDHVSLSGNASYFVFINFTLMGTTQLSLDYTSNGTDWTLPTSPTSPVSIPANNPDTEWSIKVETKAAAGATTGTATIEIKVDVE